LLRTPECGDGLVTAPEECDDSNIVDGDGCSADCIIEALPFCGDGELDALEECDDANRVSEDGCSERCLIEAPSMPDGGVPTPDAGMPDAGVPGTPPPVGGTVTGGCSVGHRRAPLDPIVCLVVLGFALARRRRIAGADVGAA